MTKLSLIYPAVFLLAFSITVIIEKRLIPFLQMKAEQPIYEDGPTWHLSKKGTPTMGGVAFIIAISATLLFSLFFFKNEKNCVASILISLLFALGNAFVGIFDDLTKLQRKENEGLTPIQKIFFQFILSMLFLMARAYFLDGTTVVSFSFGAVNLGVAYYPLAIILLLGIVNCANLTDGIDGLATSVSLTIGVIFFLLGLSFPSILLLSSALIGGALGFLLFNKNPAKVFMGDTGSLFLGAMAASLAFSYGNPFIIILIGGVYVIEGISVIIQVTVYKFSRKRVFKMAPLHHHFEKCGMSENKICKIAVVTTLIMSILGYILFGAIK